MEMQELKSMIYQGEKVDIECKKAESSVPKSTYESYLHLPIQRVDILFLGSRKINLRRSRKKDLCCRE